MRSINVKFRDGTARRMKADEAEVLVKAGKASYCSQSVYKALQAGIAYDKIPDKLDDRAIKVQIQAIKAKQPRKTEVQAVVVESEPRLNKAERRAKRIAAETN